MGSFTSFDELYLKEPFRLECFCLHTKQMMLDSEPGDDYFLVRVSVPHTRVDLGVVVQLLLCVAQIEFD